MRFLVDECLSVELVTVAAEAGYEAHHVAHVGKAGWKGLECAAPRLRERFRPSHEQCSGLYAEQSLHAGLVILIPNVTADLQKRLFCRAVDKLTEYGEPINHVLEVGLDGEDVIFELYELPPAT